MGTEGFPYVLVLSRARYHTLDSRAFSGRCRRWACSLQYMQVRAVPFQNEFIERCFVHVEKSTGRGIHVREQVENFESIQALFAESGDAYPIRSDYSNG